MKLTYFYRKPALTETGKENLLTRVREKVSPDVADIETELCFYVEAAAPLATGELETLRWLLSETFEPEKLSGESFLEQGSTGEPSSFLVEVGPRMNFTTSWSTNAVSVCRSCGLTGITRIERSRRYRVLLNSAQDREELERLLTLFLPLVHDRMTECHYPERLTSFETGIKPEPVYVVPLIEEGPEALKRINRKLGLGLDDWDIDYYYNLFVREIGRNPTNVECFDLGQSNSEHSRHWFFKGRLIIDGKEVSGTLMDIVTAPLLARPGNSIIAFKDNSSAIAGYGIMGLMPRKPGHSAPYFPERLNYHIIFTAETHNFPTGVAPFPGAETGTGGRIRDVHATGRGSLVLAGTAAYCVGNLNIPDYPLPWEDETFVYPSNLAPPLEIEIEASNGASDYGNKFGEPLIQGFTRS
ncbi:Phosphoribosylformylglycinamidine synthase, synthetase subunit / Phosphoribosylformylglycinamidine synthase, glutamine amidotransferase subunit, partial [hydrothermal vent metagenome]